MQPSTKIKSISVLVVAVAIAALSSVFAFSAPAQAQEGTEYDYVDLVMFYEQSPPGSRGNNTKVAYSVRNVGTATATGATVSFLLEDLALMDSDIARSRITDKRTENRTNQRFTWHVGTIPPNSSTLEPLTFATELHPGRHSEAVYGNPGRVGTISATASSIQPEPASLLANNTIKIYSFSSPQSPRAVNQVSAHMGTNELGLLLYVSNLRPEAGGDVNFDLAALNLQRFAAPSGHIDIITNINIGVTLSDGLEFKKGWTPPDEFVKSGSQSAAWQPAAVDKYGRTTRPGSREIAIETQLTSDSLEEIPLDERCIIAWVEDSKPPPSPSYALGSLKQCLGDDPPVLLSEGSVAFLTSFPCIDDSRTDAHQCQNVPGIAVAANLSFVPEFSTFDDLVSILRSQGVGRSDQRNRVFLDPESVFIQVKDPEGRVQDSNTTQRVAPLSWQTANDPHADIGGRQVHGVAITYTRRDIRDATAWNSLGPRTLTVRGIDGGDPPGGVKIRLNHWRNTFFDLTSPTYSVTKNAFNIDSLSNQVVEYFADFETLGTYLLDYSLTMTDSGSNQYTDAGTYTFHVGPVSELEVRDAGPSTQAPNAERTLAIVAVNNGPDSAPGAQVTVTGLSASDYVSHSATKGSFDSTTGIWTIGKLITKDVSQPTRGRDGEVLTIVTSADAGTEITATITNTEDYEVCIDSSGDDVDAASESVCTATSGNTWHTAKYYDHISDNNTATLTARPGIGGTMPETRPGSVQVLSLGSGANMVTWGDSQSGDRHPEFGERDSWDIDYNDQDGSGWKPLVHSYNQYSGLRYYIDQSGDESRTYRVRARYAAQVGDWTEPGQAAEADTRPLRITELRATGGDETVTLEWNTPGTGGSPILGYQMRQQREGGGYGSWDDITTDGSATSHTVMGLTNGDTYTFQVRAVNEQGPAPASNEASAVPLRPAPPNAPDAPTVWPTLGTTTSLDIGWNAPSNQGRPAITGYDLRYRSGGGSWNDGPQDVDGTITRIAGLTPGASYEVQVRAENLWASQWSESGTARARSSSGVAPGAISDLSAATVANSGLVQLSWTAPAQTGAPVTHYDIRRCSGRSCDPSTGSWERFPEGHATLHRSGGFAGKMVLNARGMTEDSRYGFQVRAVDATGEVGPASNTAEGIAGRGNVPAGKIQTLTATAGEGQVILRWDEPENAGKFIEHYMFRYCAGADCMLSEEGWRQYYAIDNPRMLTITGLEGGVTHRFQLYARNRALSEPSDAVWATPWGDQAAAPEPGPTYAPSADPPDAITALEAESGPGSGLVRLYWPPVTNTEAPVTHYDLRWCRGSGCNPATGSWQQFPESQTQGPLDWFDGRIYYVARGLTAGAEYRFQVRAVDASGAEGSESNTAGAIAGLGKIPAGPVSNLTAEAGNGQVTLRWNAPANNGDLIRSYHWRYCAGVDCLLGPKGWHGSRDSGSQVSSQVVTGLTNGVTYRFQVVAFNNTESQFSEVVVAMPTEQGATAQATGAFAQVLDPVVATAKSLEAYNTLLAPDGDTASNSAPVFEDGDTASRSVVENTPAGSDIGSPIAATDDDGDDLTYSLGGPDASSFSIVESSGQLQAGSALDYEDVYSYTVEVTVDDGNDGSDTITVTIDVNDQEEPPSAPAAPEVTAAPAETDKLDVSWSTPDNAGKPAIEGYDLRYQHNGGGWEDGPGDVSGTSAQISGLDADTTYEVQVRASNAEGDSPWSASGSGSTHAPGSVPPGSMSIADLQAEPGPGNGLVQLIWTAPTDGGAPITHYDLRLCEGRDCDPPTASWQRFSESKTDLYEVRDEGSKVETVYYYVRGLTPGGEYRFQVRAVDATGIAGQPSNQDGASARHGQVPSGMVTDLTAEAGDGHVTLRWSEPSNEGNAIDRYLYRYCQGADCALSPVWWTYAYVTVGPSMSLVVGELTNGETYRFQVQVRNGSLSEYSEAVVATPTE